MCSLQARVQEFISSGESRVDNSTASFCLPDLKLQPRNCTTLPPAALDWDNGKNRDNDGQKETHKNRPRSEQTTETFTNQKHLRETELIDRGQKDKEKQDIDLTMSPATSSNLSEYIVPDSHKRTVHTLPNFAEALVEARKARYIRYYGQVLCEKELSIGEIFSKNEKD